MEHTEATIIDLSDVHDFEFSKASNAYLMSIVALIVGLPLPIINLAATAIIYLENRKSSFFVRWHSTQALLSQLFTVVLNSISFYWTFSILFGSIVLTDSYVAYIIVILLFNLWEWISTLIAASRLRKGKHFELFFFGPITHLIIQK